MATFLFSAPARPEHKTAEDATSHTALETTEAVSASQAEITWRLSWDVIQEIQAHKGVIRGKRIRVLPSSKVFEVIFDPGVPGATGGGGLFGNQNNARAHASIHVSGSPATHQAGVFGAPSSPFTVTIFVAYRAGDHIDYRQIQTQNINTPINRRTNVCPHSDLVSLAIDGFITFRINITIPPEPRTVVTQQARGSQVLTEPLLTDLGLDDDDAHVARPVGFGQIAIAGSRSGEWSGRMLELIASDVFGDIQIRCSDDEYVSAHKDILSGFSPVFEAMFTHMMQESLQNEILIDDFESSVIRHAVLYMYTGTLASDLDLNVIGPPLLRVADKYKIMGLAKLIFSYLASHISPPMVATSLMLCKLYRGVDCVDVVRELEKNVMTFIARRDNMQDMLASESFHVMFQEHPDLVKRILMRMTSK